MHTGPYTAVRRVERLGCDQGGESKRLEVGIGKSEAQGRAAADSPRPVWTTCCLSSEILNHAPGTQLCKPHSATLPLLPGDASQPSPNPRIKLLEHIDGLTVAEVALPPNKILGKLRYHLLQPYGACPTGQFPDAFLQALDGLRRYSPLRLWT